MKKTAIITGISGQDGSYLTEYLLARNYEIHGLVRHHSQMDRHLHRINHLLDSINIERGDILDAIAVEKFIRSVQPDEIYHLAAQSDVHLSFQLPSFTTKTNVIGTINVLEACKQASRYCKFYNASSSEIFGNNKDEDDFQRETTTMGPITPYGCGKLFTHHFVKNYRRTYQMFAVNGVAFNHESPRRGTNFVTTKIIKAAKRIKKGKQRELRLGNLEASRDWGHAKDYVAAMHLMMHHKEPDDFVLASGKSHTIRELCEYVFKKLDMDYAKYVTGDDKLLRPEDRQHVKGDPKRAKEMLKWIPEYTFESTLDEMIQEIN